jgi:4-amino-4-deoxy-L-arabinose transferase-like glycosyltransferase
MAEQVSKTQEPRDVGPFVRRDWIVLGAIVLVALLVRLIYLLQYRTCPTFADPIMDPLYHVEWARAFAGGESFMAGEPYFRSPLYPWFLGICFQLFGEGFLLPRVFQIVMGGATCGLVFLIGRRSFGRTTGMVAGITAAVYWPLLYFEGELLIVPLLLPLYLLFLWLLMRAVDAPSWRGYLLAGLVLGLSAITRPNILLFGLAACVWVALRRAEPRPRAFGRALVMGLACLAPILPITVRNYLEGDDVVLIASQAGVNLFIGNNPESDGTRAVVPGTRAGWWEGYHDSRAMAEEAEGRSLKPSEVSRHFSRRALAYMREDPTGWLDLTGRKLRYFWNAAEIDNNQPMEFFARNFAPIVRYLPIGFGIIGPLSILGLLLGLRRPKRILPLLGFVFLYSASVIAFFICARFRMPVVVVLLIFAGEAGRWLVAGAMARRWTQVGPAALLLIPLFWWCNTRPPEFVNTDFQGYQVLGNQRLKHGDLEGAIEEFERGLALRDFAGLRLSLAATMIQRGDEAYRTAMQQGRFHQAAGLREEQYARAEVELERVLAAREGYAESYWGDAAYYLAAIAVSREHLDEAIERLELSLRFVPDAAKTHALLGRLLVVKEQPTRALPHLRHAAERLDGDPAVLFDLGRALIDAGERAEAIGLLQGVLGRYPETTPQGKRFGELLREALSSGN